MAENSSIIHSIASSSGKIWAPQLCRFVPGEILQIILQSTHHASCQRIEDAEHLVAAGFQSVLITRPIVDQEALSRVASVAAQGRLTVVIDHFRHAELLSQVVLTEGVSAEVLIEVDLGRQVTGVRPGPDSARLAAAVARLPNIRLGGVYVDDRDCGKNGPHDSTPLSFEESIGVASHCQRIIEAGGTLCSQIVSGRTQLLAAAARIEVAAVLTSPLATSQVFTNPASVVTERTHGPAFVLVCRVISRPSLEWCVIDAGHLFWHDPNQLRVHHPCGASLLHALPEIATLLLSGESLDLRIGDEVVLTHPGFADRLCLGSIRGMMVTTS